MESPLFCPFYEKLFYRGHDRTRQRLKNDSKIPLFLPFTRRNISANQDSADLISLRYKPFLLWSVCFIRLFFLLFGKVRKASWHFGMRRQNSGHLNTCACRGRDFLTLAIYQGVWAFCHKKWRPPGFSSITKNGFFPSSGTPQRQGLYNREQAGIFYRCGGVWSFIFRTKRGLCYWCSADFNKAAVFGCFTGSTRSFPAQDLCTKKAGELTPAFELVSAAVLCSVSAQWQWAAFP